MRRVSAAVSHMKPGVWQLLPQGKSDQGFTPLGIQLFSREAAGHGDFIALEQNGKRVRLWAGASQPLVCCRLHHGSVFPTPTYRVSLPELCSPEQQFIFSGLDFPNSSLSATMC